MIKLVVGWQVDIVVEYIMGCPSPRGPRRVTDPLSSVHVQIFLTGNRDYLHRYDALQARHVSRSSYHKSVVIECFSCHFVFLKLRRDI